MNETERAQNETEEQGLVVSDSNTGQAKKLRM
jgi:hypothetical protein